MYLFIELGEGPGKEVRMWVYLIAFSLSGQGVSELAGIYCQIQRFLELEAWDCLRKAQIGCCDGIARWEFSTLQIPNSKIFTWRTPNGSSIVVKLLE